MSQILNAFLALTITTSTLFAKRTEFDQIVSQVNNQNFSWKASLAQGLNYDNDSVLLKMASGTSLSYIPSEVKSISSRLRLLQANYPSSLDLRTKYPNCRSIAMVRAQSACGSCWALASMNSISDRYCIYNSLSDGSPIERFFSAQDVLECCSSCSSIYSQPCSGGYVYQAFYYAKMVGVATGESFGDTNLCKPYFLPAIVTTAPKNPTCSKSCANGNTYITPYVKDKVKIKDFFYGMGVGEMTRALNEGGSITAVMQVYSDLYAYSSGIYKKMYGYSLGIHSVRVIGYGTEGELDYWIVANSWGASWGENGFFRILKGANECGIESNYFLSATF